MFEVEYWHWIVLGMLMILAELAIPSFTIFWFGLGGFVVATLLGVGVDLSIAAQLTIWAISSALFTLLWFKLFKPFMADKTKAGIAKEAIFGESGLVIKAPSDGQRGTVRFTTPLLGAEEWPIICEQPLNVGDRVYIKELSGNTLIVETH